MSKQHTNCTQHEMLPWAVTNGGFRKPDTILYRCLGCEHESIRPLMAQDVIAYMYMQRHGSMMGYRGRREGRA